VDALNNTHGFLYNLGNQSFTTLDDPDADNNTSANGISGGNIVGYYEDSQGDYHGFLYNVGNQSYTTFDAPGTDISSNANGIEGSSIVGDFRDSNSDFHGYLATPVVSVAPTITVQPANVGVLVGKSATFSVKATGTAPLTYQWYFKSKKISGATKASYTIAKVAAANVGKYDVVVTNTHGKATSHTVTLAIVTAPKIVTQPKAATVNAGATAKFTVKATGSSPLTYQWQRNSVALKNAGNVSGATAATLTITKATASNAGTYRVIVKNAGASATSVSVKLTVK
jgi:hypothetical protein